VVPDRSSWRCWLGVGEAPKRGPSTSGLYRFHPRPSAYRDRSRLGHQLGVRSCCRSSSASSAARVTQVARTPSDRVTCHRPRVFTPRLRGIRLLLRGPPCHRLRQEGDHRRGEICGLIDKPRVVRHEDRSGICETPSPLRKFRAPRMHAGFSVFQNCHKVAGQIG
jgi:hypothetical protein